MSDRRTAMISVVKKLMNLATDNGAAPGEAESAMAKATEIMQKYKISEAETLAVELDKGGKFDFSEADAMNIWYPTQQWEGLLGMGIALVFDCRGFVSVDRDWTTLRLTKKMVFVGLERDLLNCAYFFDYLQDHIAGVSKRELGRNAYVQQYCDFGMGMVDRITSRLKELMAKVSDNLDATTTALVVRKGDELSTHMKKNYSLRSTRAKLRDGRLYAKGQAAGEKTRLSPGVAGRTTQTAPQIA